MPPASFANGWVKPFRSATFADTLFRFDAMSAVLQPAVGNRGLVVLSVDSPEAGIDTTKKHSPQRAALFSAVVPGLGQVYNKQYWKVPVIYAGGAVAGYLIYYNYGLYNNLRKSFRYRRDGDSTTSLERFSVWAVTGDLDVNLENFGDSELLGLQQSYRRDLDLSVLLAFGIYALNVVDAVVFAHLYDFDVSEDLTLRLKPDLQHVNNGPVQNGAGGVKPAVQLGLTYRF
jgi:hypothetical protein